MIEPENPFAVKILVPEDHLPNHKKGSSAFIYKFIHMSVPEKFCV